MKEKGGRGSALGRKKRGKTVERGHKTVKKKEGFLSCRKIFVHKRKKEKKREFARLVGRGK